MQHAASRAGVVCLALALSACGGGGDGTEDPTAGGPTPPPTSPAPPAPDPAPAPPGPTPSPDPPSDNSPPVANAGSDKATVEEQDVTIDGSASRDPDGDALTYQWTLVSAPPGSSVAIDANTPSFAFRPDLPGEYQLQLTASDGSASASDRMRVSADALFSIAAPMKFSIDGSSAAGSDRLDLTLTTSARYAGGPVAFIVTSDAPWLTVPASGTLAAGGAATSVALQLELDELARMENGAHQAHVNIAPNGGWTGASADITLDLALPVVRTVLPYVAYVGEASRVTLHGERLLKADGKSLFVGGAEALDLEAVSDTKATIDLPSLPAGTYTVRIGHELDAGREMARVVVRERPVYRDVDGFDISGSPESVEYDAERDAFYYVVFAPNGVHFAFGLRNDGTGTWHHVEVLGPDRFEPQALALSADGTELFVTSIGCWVHRLDPGSFAILESTQKPDCAEGSDFSAIAPLADGRVLVLEDRLNEPVAFLEYPGFAESDVLPSRRFDTFLVLNRDRDRLLYVQPQEAGADVYDLDSESRRVQLPENPAGLPPGTHLAGLRPATLSMSANASRTLHASNVYDRDFNLIGRLAGDRSIAASALNAQGTRAVALDFETNALHVYDVGGSASDYPEIAATAALPDDIEVFSPLVFVPPSGGAVFAVGFEHDEPRGHNRFYVRLHAALTR